VARTELMLGHFLAMDPGDAKKKIDGIETREPAFNLPALWIPEKKKEEAQYAGYTVVDIPTVIATHITELIRTYADELLSRQDVQKLIDTVAQTNSKVVEELTPLLNIGHIQKVLQNLLRERVSIRDLQTILETLADHAALTKDPDLLTEFVRQKLARSIVRQYETREGELPLLTLGQDIEDLLAKSINDTDRGGAYLSLDPQAGQAILRALNNSMDVFLKMNYQPILLCSPMIRRHLRKLTERFLPNLVILSHSELTPTVNLKVLGEVGLADAH